MNKLFCGKKVFPRINLIKGGIKYCRSTKRGCNSGSQFGIKGWMGDSWTYFTILQGNSSRRTFVWMFNWTVRASEHRSDICYNWRLSEWPPKNNTVSLQGTHLPQHLGQKGVIFGLTCGDPPNQSPIQLLLTQGYSHWEWWMSVRTMNEFATFQTKRLESLECQKENRWLSGRLQ